jgi:large subunit ribosomal protein L23
MFDPYSVIIRPLVTEQSMSGLADKKYAFVVARPPIKQKSKMPSKRSFL